MSGEGERTATIIVTSYNYARFLAQCVESCLSQSMSADEFEVLVIDDRSSDGSQDVLAGFAGRGNVRIASTLTNVGVAATSNVGVEAAIGRYVVRVDADDTVAPDMLPILCGYLDAHPDCFCVACDYQLVNVTGTLLEERSAREHPISCGIAYRRTALLKAGLYDPAFRHLEERELRGRLGYRDRPAHVPIALYRYRMHGMNKSQRSAERGVYERMLEARQR